MLGIVVTHTLALAGLNYCPCQQPQLPVIAVTVQSLDKEMPQATYRGTVKAVTNSSLTIDIPEEQLSAIKTDANGRAFGIELIIIPPRGQRTFSGNKLLQEGKSGWADETYGYRLTDLKIGDKVKIWCAEPLIIKGICIQRRPGGKVPPSPLSKANDSGAWHVVMNAQQLVEEKGCVEILRIGLRLLR